MVGVLQHLHTYVAKNSSGDKTLYHETGLVGDELTIERAVNCLWQMHLHRTTDLKECILK